MHTGAAPWGGDKVWSRARAFHLDSAGPLRCVHMSSGKTMRLPRVTNDMYERACQIDPSFTVALWPGSSRLRATARCEQLTPLPSTEASDWWNGNSSGSSHPKGETWP